MATYNLVTTTDIGKGLVINPITKLLDVNLSSDANNILSFDNTNSLQVILPTTLQNINNTTPINNTVLRYTTTFEYVTYNTIKMELYPLGNNNKILRNNNGDFGLVNNVESDGDDIIFLDSTNTSSSTEKSKIISFNDGINSKISFVDSDSVVRTPAMTIGKGRVSYLFVNPGTATFTALGMGTITQMSGGSAATVAIAASKIGQIRKIRYTSNGFNDSYAGIYDNNLRYFIGSSSDLGGFQYNARFGLSDSVTNTRTFVGLTTLISSDLLTAYTGRTNFIGILQDTTTPTPTNFYIAINGTSTAAYLVDTGFTYATGDWYDFEIYCPPNASQIRFKVRRINDESVFTTTIDLATIGATKYPSRTTLLTPRFARGSASNYTTVSIDVSYVYIESFNS